MKIEILFALLGLVCIFWIGIKMRNNAKKKKQSDKVINLAERRRAKEMNIEKKIKKYLK